MCGVYWVLGPGSWVLGPGSWVLGPVVCTWCCMLGPWSWVMYALAASYGGVVDSARLCGRCRRCVAHGIWRACRLLDTRQLRPASCLLQHWQPRIDDDDDHDINHANGVLCFELQHRLTALHLHRRRETLTATSCASHALRTLPGQRTSSLCSAPLSGRPLHRCLSSCASIGGLWADSAPPSTLSLASNSPPSTASRSVCFGGTRNEDVGITVEYGLGPTAETVDPLTNEPYYGLFRLSFYPFQHGAVVPE
eukprot:1988705-Rhodomonas_salina.1